MKMGVETPAQLVDINRLPLAQIEELPDGGVAHRARLSRNSDVAEHPLVDAALSGLEPGVARGRQSAAAQHGDDRR